MWLVIYSLHRRFSPAKAISHRACFRQQQERCSSHLHKLHLLHLLTQISKEK